MTSHIHMLVKHTHNNDTLFSLLIEKRAYSDMVFGLSDNVLDCAIADPTLFSLNEGQSQHITATLIMPYQVTDIIAGICIPAAFYLRVYPVTYRVRKRHI